MTLERCIKLIAGTFVLASWLWGLGQPLLVLVHGLRGRKFVSTRAHQVVSHGRHLEGWESGQSQTNACDQTPEGPEKAQRILKKAERNYWISNFHQRQR